MSETFPPTVYTDDDDDYGDDGDNNKNKNKNDKEENIFSSFRKISGKI